MKPGSCQATAKAGKPCSAAVQPGRPYCLWHDPEAAEARRRNSQKGGRASSNAARARKQFGNTVRDLTDVKARLMAALIKVEQGDLEPGAANAMANIARAIVAVAGVAEFEGQLAEMRSDIADLSARRGA